MSNVAWCKLTQRRLVEKDSRVLEAYKVSQVCSTVCGNCLYCVYHPTETYSKSDLRTV